MIAYCQSGLPNEACGLLSGKNNIHTKVWPINNIAKSPTQFEMGENEVDKVIQSVKKRGEVITGVYHSHPTAKPYPSEADINYGQGLGVDYFIISLLNKNPIIRCFDLSESKLTEKEIHIL
jgi:[CysO sulfur-carrier protein]-S-L-cysteine hydrolase